MLDSVIDGIIGREEYSADKEQCNVCRGEAESAEQERKEEVTEFKYTSAMARLQREAMLARSSQAEI